MKLAIHDNIRSQLTPEEQVQLEEADRLFAELLGRMRPVKKKFCTIVNDKDMRIWSVVLGKDCSTCAKPIYTGKKYWLDTLHNNHPRWRWFSLVGIQIWY